jgi:predicted metalloprotease with PDZ domain
VDRQIIIAPQVSPRIYGAPPAVYYYRSYGYPVLRPTYVLPSVAPQYVVPPALLSDYGLGLTSFRVTAAGCRVLDVDPSSPAGLAGLEPGDLILGVRSHAFAANGWIPIAGAYSWRTAMANNSGYIRLRVQDGRTGSIVDRDVDLN